MRTLVDSAGVQWTVFEVKGATAPGERPSYLPVEFGDGWLCFECGTSKRRLTQVPPRWREFGDEELMRMLERARPVIRSRPSAEDRAAVDPLAARAHENGGGR